MNELQAIFFDFDGVLAKSMDVKTEAFKKMFERYGEEVVKKVVDHHIKYGGISRYDKIKHYYKHYIGKDITKKELDKAADYFSSIVVDKIIVSDWVKGAKEFLENNCDKIDMFVVSGTPQKELELIIEQRNMKNFFKGVYGSPDTKDQIMNRLILERKYQRNKVIFIGDSLSDYEAAEKSKIGFLGISQSDKSIFPEGTKITLDFSEVDLRKLEDVLRGS
jgi:phosphoglycolate phosphatase-like HAD superfamily hydrolase